MVILKVDEVFIAISNKYTDFGDIFLPDLITKLSEYIGINDHAIDLINSK